MRPSNFHERFPFNAVMVANERQHKTVQMMAVNYNQLDLICPN